mgnify:CR=1 FL=1
MPSLHIEFAKDDTWSLNALSERGLIDYFKDMNDKDVVVPNFDGLKKYFNI